MRSILYVAAACTLITTRAAMWEIDFGPSVGGFGLNGQNERPLPPTPSPATGREIKDYNSENFMLYDDDANRLELHFGWGSASEVGGTDLTADFTMMHIHGPADENGSALPIYTLATWSGAGNPTLYPSEEIDDTLFLSQTGYRSALYDVTFTLVEGQGGYTVAQQEAQLLANDWYINVHSEGTYAGGEIRGQMLLIAVPEPAHYAAMAGVVLLGFAGYRRFKMARA